MVMVKVNYSFKHVHSSCKQNQSPVTGLVECLHPDISIKWLHLKHAYLLEHKMNTKYENDDCISLNTLSSVHYTCFLLIYQTNSCLVTVTSSSKTGRVQGRLYTFNLVCQKHVQPDTHFNSFIDKFERLLQIIVIIMCKWEIEERCMLSKMCC